MNINDDIARLLNIEGYFTAHNKSRSVKVYYRFGKWFVQKKSVLLFLWRKGLALNHIVNIGVLRLYKDPTARDYQFMLFRQKEFNKISFFDLVNQSKTVIWDDAKSMDRELSARGYYEARNISIPPILSLDSCKLRMTQRLVGTFLDNYSSYDDVVDLLTMAHTTNVHDYADKGDYESSPSNGSYQIDISQNLPDKWSDDIMTRLGGYLKREDVSIPLVMAHGDPSRFNVLRDGDAYYLNDYDRSFRASIYYDFVYLYINNRDFGKRRFIDAANKLHGILGFNRSLSESETHELAIMLFIVDTMKYIISFVSSNLDAGQEQLAFSLTLLDRAFNKLENER